MSTTNRIHAGQGSGLDPNGRAPPPPRGEDAMRSTSGIHAGQGPAIDPDG